MQNMMVAAPLIAGTLHIDMDVMPDTSLVRVTIYLPTDNDGDLCIGRIAQPVWGPALGGISSDPGASCSHMECADSYLEQGEDGPDLRRCGAAT